MLNWSQIDTVLLDMDGTLLDLHFDSYFWLEFLPLRYAALHRMDEQEARTWLHERLRKEQGTLNWYCLDYWSSELGVDITAMKREVSDKIAFRPYVEDFLRTLNERDVRTVIVTNAHWGSLNLKKELTAIHTLVDGVVCSHTYQMPKEDVNFWDRLQQDEPFDKARTLLVDDSLSVLKSPQEYGIGHLLSIVQPDSQQPPRQIDEFNAIHHFDEIMPEK